MEKRKHKSVGGGSKRKRKVTDDSSDTDDLNLNTLIKNEIDPIGVDRLESDLETDTDVTHFEIFELLKKIHQKQNVLGNRLSNLEKTYEVHSNIQRRTETLEKMVRENLVLTKQIHKDTKRLVDGGMTDDDIQMEHFFPLTSHLDLHAMEEKLQDIVFEQGMREYMEILKANFSLEEVFRKISDDQLIHDYNWEGRNGKQSLKAFKLYNQILYDSFKDLDKQDFEKQIRRCIELSHNRYKSNQKYRMSLNQ